MAPAKVMPVEQVSRELMNDAQQVRVCVGMRGNYKVGSSFHSS